MGELMSQKLLLMNMCVFVCSFFIFFHGVSLVFCSKILKKNKSKSRRNELKKKEIFH